MLRSATALFSVSFWWLFQVSVAAGPFRMLGYDSWSIGVANTQGAYGKSIGVLFTNPSLLTDLDLQLGATFTFLQPSARAKPMPRPKNADIPLSFYDSDAGIGSLDLDRPLPTVELPLSRQDNLVQQSQAYFGLGLVHSLGIPDFRIAFSTILPTRGVLALAGLYPDEREQYFSNTIHFARYGEWDQLISLFFGAAFRPLDWFSFGVSVEGSLLITATLDIYIPDSNVQQYSLANTKMDASITYRPIVGLNFRPLDFLTLGVIWRDRRFTKVTAEAELKLWNYHESAENPEPKRVQQTHLMALDFEPMEIALAVGIIRNPWMLEIMVTWNHWADYLDRHHTRAQHVAKFEPVNPGDVRVQGEDFAFSDTFSVSVGAFWEYLEGWVLTAGGAYRPTPVPPQIGRTNYVDNDVVVFALGHRFHFKLGKFPLQVDVGLQGSALLPSTVHKDPALLRDEFPDHSKTLIDEQPMPEAAGLQTNNPGFPGYSAKGMSFLGSASLIVPF